MIGPIVQRWLEWLRRVVTEPRAQLTRWQRFARDAYDLGRYGARQLRQDKAPQMAAALAFRTLFGLLPVLVVGTILVRTFRGWDRFHETLAVLLAEIGLDAVEVFPSEGEQSTTLAQWLLDLIAQVETINLAAIGWVGVGVLIYSAISLMITIEASFNTICRAPTGRSWTFRVPLYWFVLSLGPAAIALTVYMDGRFDAMIQDVSSWNWLLVWGGRLWSFVIAWLIMFAVYKLVPTRSVAVRPALIGAFVAALLLALGKFTLGAYLKNALSIQQLYGSLGLIPLFMFWVYLMWLVILFGLEVAAAVHLLGGRRVEEIESRRRENGLVDPASVLTVMAFVASRFAAGHTCTAEEIAEAVGVPEPVLAPILDRLVESGDLHPVDRGEGAFALARPADQIDADRLMRIGFELVDQSMALGRRSALLERLRAAQRALTEGATLASLIAPEPRPATDQAGST